MLEVLVAIYTGDYLFKMISAGKSLGSSSMHFFCLMTCDAIHIIFCDMYIALAPHAVILISYPAAMTCSTLVKRI